MANPASYPPTIDYGTIQGDIIFGLPKKHQSFVFYTIENVTGFREALEKTISQKLITTTADVCKHRKDIKQYRDDRYNNDPLAIMELVCLNIAFSSDGLRELGIDEDLGDDKFTDGQFNTAVDDLGDPERKTTPTEPEWNPEFGEIIHVCFNFTGDCAATVKSHIVKLEGIFTVNGALVLKKVHQINGTVRPGKEKGKEHFGFQDDLSNPPIIGFREPNKGEVPTRPGVILLGRPGDCDGDSEELVTRPSWTLDGSFFVLRQLCQRVPEFHAFVKKKSPKHGTELFGARMMGRWKSGASVYRNPTQDALGDADDLNKVNNFNYVDGSSTMQPQLECPFSAHLRKSLEMNPRVGFPGPNAVTDSRIIRHGIPYGPELTSEESHSKKTTEDRGLLFVSSFLYM
ncbi:hypothetical protein HWV62_16986 [Athelia sp. TMB]|nr:hypothetical protein HWV62_16986 [Athelia sp. TMB]